MYDMINNQDWDKYIYFSSYGLPLSGYVKKWIEFVCIMKVVFLTKSYRTAYLGAAIYLKQFLQFLIKLLQQGNLIGD